MRARAPASSANLGPGFDTLALALALYVDVDVQPASSFSITTTGEGADLPNDRDHFVARIVCDVIGHDNVAIRVHSDIPIGRGLGSSAAVAAAAASAAGSNDVLGVAAAVDGHPENAAASVLGGLVTATTVAGTPIANRLALDPDLAFVVLVPDRTLPTEEARAALPPSVPHVDATFNLGRLALLLAGLGDRSRLQPAATEDRLHQNYRGALFSEAAGLLDGLVREGALASCWSGAGPSLLAICDGADAEAIRVAGEGLLARAGVTGRALRLAADLDGITRGE